MSTSVIFYLWTFLYFTKKQNLRCTVKIRLFVQEWECAVNIASERSFRPVKSPIWPVTVTWSAFILRPGLSSFFHNLISFARACFIFVESKKW